MRSLSLLVLLFFLSLSSVFSQNFSDTEFLINSTIKIQTIERNLENGQYYESSGTGFFFNFQNSLGSNPVIVTNKHVIANSESGTLAFKLKNNLGQFSRDSILVVTINSFKDKWIFHPDTLVDLAIFPISSLLEQFNKKGKVIYFTAFTENELPNDSINNSLSAIEDIIMIGYPFGLLDKANNLPIVRRGLTATPSYLNYNFVPEFLCDIPVFPGSSGSPVILFNPTSFTTREGLLIFDSRLLLLGINYATYTKDFQGKIIPKISYNSNDTLITQTPIPYNIGIVIKAERILDFKSFFLK